MRRAASAELVAILHSSSEVRQALTLSHRVSVLRAHMVSTLLIVAYKCSINKCSSSTMDLASTAALKLPSPLLAHLSSQPVALISATVPSMAPLIHSTSLDPSWATFLSMTPVVTQAQEHPSLQTTKLLT